MVGYYSASGNTEAAAGYIAEATNADTLELVPVEPYSDKELDWTTDGSRVNNEHDDESLSSHPHKILNRVDMNGSTVVPGGYF